MLFKTMWQKKTSLPLITLLLLIGSNAFSQEDPLNLDDMPTQRVSVKEAFNGTHIIYGQSTDMLESKRLDILIGHRFGKITKAPLMHLD